LIYKNIQLKIEYDGTFFSGWQKQKNSISIQSVLEDTLKKIAGHSVDLIVAGRTDAGVHALGQICNFQTCSKLSPFQFKRIANLLLPKDIHVKMARIVPKSFHATYDAVSKIYRYVIRQSAEDTVWDRFYYYRESRPLNLFKMRTAAKLLIGKHDFSAFCGALGRKRANPNRILKKIKIRQCGNDIYLEFCGVSFLHQMVRILSGTLLYAGLGKIKPQDVVAILKSKDRREAGPTLPAKGLFLVKVFYSMKDIKL
jgi:tRNA pseudouridine38-40 synthase